MKLLDSLLSVFRKAGLYDELKLDYDKLKINYDALLDAFDSQNLSYQKLRSDYSVLQKVFKDSKLEAPEPDPLPEVVVPVDEEIDMSAAIKKLYNSLEPRPFLYPFKGNGVDIDIKFYLKVLPEQEVLVGEVAKDISDSYSVSSPLAVVEAVMKYFIYKRRPVYVSEKVDKWDWYNFLLTWRDDCDAVAGAMYVLIKYLLEKNGFESSVPRLLFHINNNYKEGHANCLWLHDDGYFYTVESTMDLKGTFNRKWLNVPLAYDSFYTVHRAFATSSRSYVGSNVVRAFFG